MGLEGAGDLQEASPALQSGIWQELKVPRAPQDLQVGMLVWSSPGVLFHHLWEQRALRGAPKAEAAPGKALGKGRAPVEAPSAPADLGQLRGGSWQDAVLATQE